MGIFDKLSSLLGGSSETPASKITAHSQAPVVEEEAASWQAPQDLACFDFENDLGAWYVAERRIEMAWEDNSQRNELFSSFGIRDENHFRDIREAFSEYASYIHQTEGQDALNEMMQVKMDAERVYFQSAAQATFQATSPELIEAIEGVTIEAYAAIVGRQVAGEDLDAVIREAGMDRAKYDRVAEGWNNRMGQDTTFSLATAYGSAFNAASNNSRGTATGPTISWEKYIETTEAMSELTKIGMDPQTVMQQLGVTLAEYVAAGQHYSEWFHANAGRDPEILNQANAYHAKYQAKYAAAKQDQDIEF